MRRASRRLNDRQPKTSCQWHGLGEYGGQGQVHARSRAAILAGTGPRRTFGPLGASPSRAAMCMALSMLEEATVLGASTLRRALWLSLLLPLALAVLAACGDSPVNSPYAKGQDRDNTLYTAFTQR